ncbi:hypothetical protein MPNTM1_04892 [Mycolicibacterium parafortuitum]|uniref:tyrosine-type recombinase/integrase n=1 Tax=Mycolicibacterium parafortuitum TaxID=39692 RepID=UPI0032C45E15
MTRADERSNFPTSTRRQERTDPRLELARLFDPDVAKQLWDSLPPQCRVDRITKKNMPEIYRGAIKEHVVGGGKTDGDTFVAWSSVGLNFSELPETMRWEIAWLIHREVELGRFINVNMFGSALRALRLAAIHGTARGRAARSLLELSANEWLKEVQYARLNGQKLGLKSSEYALHRIRQLQDVLVYGYHRGDWWELNVWNPYLDSRIPQRPHEPSGRSAVNFSNLTSPWLREAVKLWLSASLLNGTLSWSSVKSRIDNLKWLQRQIDRYGDHGPALTSDPHDLRSFVKSFCRLLESHRIASGQRNAGQPFGKNPRRQIMVSVEKFYQWMYDHRSEASSIHRGWAELRPDHCALFRPEDKPRMTNKRPDEPLALEDEVVRRIAEGCELLTRPKNEGGMADLQAFHALMLLIRTGRRVNEVLMMDFEPLVPLTTAKPTRPETDGDDKFVARLRYQQTKIESVQSQTIPVDGEVVAIVRAQQVFAREFMSSMGLPGVEPRYLFVRTRVNRHGKAPYSMATMHTRLLALAEALAITDSAGRAVEISKTHRFRHTAATNLINAGVPLHVVMRYFGHVSPEMTLHYAITRDQTMEEEFLKYKKVTRDGRTAEIEGSDLYDLLHLDKRADRVLPNGWCTLPPKQLCNKGNACLSCSKFVTDATHEPELRRQLDSTTRLIDLRQEAFTSKYGTPMGQDNIWLQGRREEVASLNRILLSISDVTDRAVRGTGVHDAPKGGTDA